MNHNTRTRLAQGIALESLMQQVASDEASVEHLLMTVPTVSGWLIHGRRHGMRVTPVGAARCFLGEDHLWPAVVALITREAKGKRREETRRALLFIQPGGGTWRIIVGHTETVAEAQLYFRSPTTTVVHEEEQQP